MKQWTFERPYTDRASAMKHRRATVTLFLRQLKRKKLSGFNAPQMPSPSLKSEYFIETDRGCRVIVGWVPDWSPTRNAGKHVVRVDTLVT